LVWRRKTDHRANLRNSE